MNDLTRWNRSGLTRFRYVDGNAATHLETLRLALVSRFVPAADAEAGDWRWWQGLWEDMPADPAILAALTAQIEGYRDALIWEDLWVAPPSVPEAPDKREARLLGQYRDDRRDYAWEIMRALARALHVLTEHIDAFANEGYLDTATQWESLRRLVAMLDYKPAPPASAETRLAIEAETAGTLEQGFRVKYAPPDGGAPLIFESLTDVALVPALNEIRAIDWNRSPDPVTGTILELEEKVEKARVGEPVLIESTAGGKLLGFLIQSLLARKDRTAVALPRALVARDGFIEGRTLLHLRPKDRLTLLGPGATQ